jgi:hypothetical protein
MKNIDISIKLNLDLYNKLETKWLIWYKKLDLDLDLKQKLNLEIYSELDNELNIELSTELSEELK